MTEAIRQALRQNPVTALIGPRQCGKTTLARHLAAQEPHEYFDLEAPSDLERLAHPMTTLQPLKGLVVVDEVQRMPNLFPLLRVLSDRRPLPARFLLLGSASPDLLRNSSESLAGRVAFVNMAGFGLSEAGVDSLRSLGESHPTVKRHLDILTGALMVRQLPPWFENLGKRQVKSPKVYLRDSGILHELLGVDSFARLEGHPKLGASCEGFVIEEVLRVTGDRQAYFWGTHSGHELDLLVFVNGRRIGIELKYSDAVSMTKSMHVALADLKLDRLLVVHPGAQCYPLDDKAEAVAIGTLREKLTALHG